MTFAPPTLGDLARYWTSQGGVNLGIVGDTAHAARGVSYHLGRDQLLPDAYSARTARDRAGLTNAASAIDLGKLGGSFTRLRAFSSWLVERARADAPGTRDLREIIWTPNGKTVYGWSREAGVNSAPIPGYGDASHLTHTHISFYRDSEFRAKRGLFEPYFGVLPPDTATEETDMQLVIRILPFGGTFTVPAGKSATGYVLAEATGKLASPKSLAGPASGHYDALVSTSAARGNPFIRITDGPLAGHVVTSASVDETENPAPTAPVVDVKAAVNEALDKVRANATAGVATASAAAIAEAVTKARPA